MDNDDSSIIEETEEQEQDDDIEIEEEDHDDVDGFEEEENDNDEDDDYDNDMDDDDDHEDSDDDDDDDDDEDEEDYEGEEITTSPPRVVTSSVAADATTIMAVDEGGEIDVCPICYLSWTSSGQHQICCLPCGHIYGLSCINKWLQTKRSGSRKCPQCNSLCKLKDVRLLYATPLCVADEEFHKEQMPLEKFREYLKEEEREKRRVQLDELREVLQVLHEAMCEQKGLLLEGIDKFHVRFENIEEFLVLLQRMPKDVLTEFCTTLFSKGRPLTK